MIGRLALLLGGLGLGVVSGGAAVVLHQAWGWLVLAAAAAGAVMTWLRPGAARMGFAAGWTVAVLRGALPKPEGDYLVPANGPGWTLLAGSLALVLAALVTLRPRGRRVDDHGDRPTPT